MSETTQQSLYEAFGIVAEMERNRAKFLANQLDVVTLVMYLKHDAANLLKIATAMQENFDA